MALSHQPHETENAQNFFKRCKERAHYFVGCSAMFCGEKCKCDAQYKQESLANAKVSARQQCVYEGPLRRNVRQINTRNTMLKSIHSVGYNAIADNTGH